MGRKHKYFRNQIYKNKLECKSDCCYPVYFLTKKPDPRCIRINQSDNKRRGHEDYIYWERPEVRYSIQEFHFSPKRSKVKKMLKKRANKKVRQNPEYFNNGLYKKQYDIPWTID